jgi:hypothetical protein
LRRRYAVEIEMWRIIMAASEIPPSPHGNGVLLWFELDDFDAAVARAESLNAEIVMPRHRNPPNSDSGPNHWELWLRDPDGYMVVLASPDGSADGSWRPAVVQDSTTKPNRK